MEAELCSGSGTDQESVKSGIKSSGSELLSITEAAVEALDGIKQTSNLHQLHSQEQFPNLFEQLVCSDVSFSEAKSESNGSRSSTASEVLIRSTSLDISNEHASLDKSSASSTNSFLSGQARPVKVSSKKLREIKPPFERLNKNNSAIKEGATRQSTKSDSSDSPQGSQKENIKPDKIGIVRNQNLNVKVTVEKHVTGSYPKPDSQTKPYKSNITQASKKTHQEFSSDVKQRLDDAGLISSRTAAHRETGRVADSGYSTHKWEDLSSKAPGSQNVQNPDATLEGVPTLQEDMVIDVMAREADSASEGSRMTEDSCSSQPEIVTVPETIVTVRGTDVNRPEGYSSSVSSMEASYQSVDTEVKLLPTSNHNRFTKYQPAFLHQGTLVSDSDAASVSTAQREELQISKYNVQNKRQILKDKFAKRQAPTAVKKVIQPKFVHQQNVSKSTHVSDAPGKSQSSDPVTTAAVAAASAVAATQPFLRAQHEMEQRMADVLSRLATVQSQPPPNRDANVEEELRRKIMELEGHVADLGGKRLDSLERMQQQQMDFQAQLISITRQDATSHLKPSGRSPHFYPDKPAYTPARPTQPSPECSETAHGGVLHREREKLMDTPAPRGQPPQPTARLYYTQPTPDTPYHHTPEKRPRKGAGLLEEILASQDETPKQSPFAPSPPRSTMQRTTGETSPQVKQAGVLAANLAQLSQQLKQTVSGGVSTQRAPDTPQDSFVEAVTSPGPAPIDVYLAKPKYENATSPYPRLKRDTYSHGNAPVINKYADVEEILQKTSTCRNNLEANFDAILKARQESEVYTVIEQMTQDKSATERLRMKAMVDQHIREMNKELELEILDEMLKTKETKPSMVMIPQRDMPLPKAQNRHKLRAEARVNSGLRKPKKEVESVTREKAVPKAKTKPKKPAKSLVSILESQAQAHHIYGKPAHSGQRSSPKEPYLRFTSTSPKPKASPTQVKVVRGAEIATAKTQTSQPHSVFYFDSQSHKTAGDWVPGTGQAIPMAIPLAPPTVFNTQPIKVETRAPKPGPKTSTPVRKLPAAKKVALLTEKKRKAPERTDKKADKLKIQVQPPVDKDTLIHSPSSDDKVIVTSDNESNLHPSEPKSPFEPPPLQPEEDTAQEDSLVEDEDQLTATDLQSGPRSPIALPGYLQPKSDYHGPQFPPQAKPIVREDRDSDVIAREMRRRDLLDNKAQEWIEQELMAKMISEFYQQQQQQRETQRAAASRPIEPGDKLGQAPFTAEAVGQRGLQLFIDAGQPVDDDLVNSLVKEVLLEKMAGMAGQTTSQDTENIHYRPTVSVVRKTQPQPTVTTALQPIINEEETLIRNTPVSTPLCTPDVTPCHSVSVSPPPPISPPSRHLVITPDITPTPSVMEELQVAAEELYADDDFEEHEEEAAPSEVSSAPSQMQPVSRHDVATPSSTPPSSPPLVLPTPTVGDVRTPSPTQQEATPETSQQDELPSMEEVTTASNTPEKLLEETLPPQEQTQELIEKSSVSAPVDPPPAPQEILQPESVTEESTTTSDSPPPDSCVSDTRNESFSEGQWLLSLCSVGEVASPHIEPALRDKIRQRLLMSGQKKKRGGNAAGNSDDTLQDTEELQPDENDGTDISQSEGQVLGSKLPDDKVLLAASQLPQVPLTEFPLQPHYSTRYGVDKSMGEVSVGERAEVDREMDGAPEVAGPSDSHTRGHGEDTNLDVTERHLHTHQPPAPGAEREDVGSVAEAGRSPSPSRGRRHPTLGQVVSTTDNRQHARKPRAGSSGVARPPVVQVAERSFSPDRIAARIGPYSLPYTASSVNSLGASLSDMETHTTDKMNVEAILQSRDYYASDLNSTTDLRRSASRPPFRTSNDYDLGQSSRLSYTLGSTSEMSLPAGLRESVDDRIADPLLCSQRSSVDEGDVGASYQYADSLEGTFERGQQQMTTRSGPLQVSVTIPSVAEEDSQSEDVSQISIQ